VSNIESFSAEIKQAFFRLVAKHTGLEIREREQAEFYQKILVRMNILKLNRPENYYQLLNSNTLNGEREWAELILDFTNLESYFFRDKELFNLLRNTLLPELIQRQQYNKTLRICSAGCSTGEEPYSLAILLKELIPDLNRWNLMILGVDINSSALEKAKAGIYRPWSFRNVDTEIKQRYFRLINNQYHIDSQIKEMLTFQTLNLVKDPFTRPKSELRDMDLILCRNVFIYFEPSAIANVLNKFNQALQPLGYLIAGHAELHGQNLSQFQTKVFPEALIYQRHANNIVDLPLVYSPDDKTYLSTNNLSVELQNQTLQNTNFNLYQAALNLLKQLPPDTKIPRLGNLTAAELILQVETALNLTDLETK
jgi:chemotaxis protein methyltransferase CheR